MSVERVASIGECMVELRETEPGRLVRSFGGDTLNTAVYLARCLSGTDVGADYVTALGDDPFSAEMMEAWSAEGLGVDRIVRLPGKLPGLYLIRTDDAGERTFYYWRSAAAARQLFSAGACSELMEALARYDLVYLSGITVAILDDGGRANLLRTLDAVRAAGGRVAFDTNYRPALWSGADAARHWSEEILRRADMALPTFEDEARLFGDRSPDETADRLHGLGVPEVVVKYGREPCMVSAPGVRREVPAERVERPVDTTAAGDSFNAAYLAGRLLGRSAQAAARDGHRLAAVVICEPGAILPIEATAAACAGNR